MLMGKRIRQLRIRHRLTQKQLAEIIGTSNHSIHNWEQGNQEPMLFYCIKMADLFKVSLDDLCCREFKGVN